MRLNDLHEDEDIDRALSGDAPVSDEDMFDEPLKCLVYVQKTGRNGVRSPWVPGEIKYAAASVWQEFAKQTGMGTNLLYQIHEPEASRPLFRNRAFTITFHLQVSPDREYAVLWAHSMHYNKIPTKVAAGQYEFVFLDYPT